MVEITVTVTVVAVALVVVHLQQETLSVEVQGKQAQFKDLVVLQILLLSHIREVVEEELELLEAPQMVELLYLLQSQEQQR